MSTLSVKSVNFGKTKSGLATVGYALFDATGSIAVPRTDTGVFEMGANTGNYGAQITFPANFSGTILWDTGEATPVYASDEYNAGEIPASLTSDVAFIKDMIGGRWTIDSATYQMIFYKDDNVTEVARFDLKDKNGNPSFLSVFTRQRA